jgi:hypothetical protein
MIAMKFSCARALFEKIKSLLMKNSHGYMGGTGLKLFPN